MIRATLVLLLAPGAIANLGVSLIARMGAVEARDEDSCNVGVSVAAACIANPTFMQMPEASQAKCACCVGPSNIASQYRDCASHLRSASPSQTALYTTNMLLASACSSASSLCAASATSATSATGTLTSTWTSTIAITSASREPAACLSLRSVISSCSRAVPSFFSLPGSGQASCICSNSIGGTFTTAFDRYAASCASYYRTASPSSYSVITSLSTFCSRQGSGPKQTATSESNPWAVPGGTGTSSNPTTPTAAFTGTTTVTGSGSPASTTSSNQAVRPAAAIGSAAWIASSWTFLVSLFVLV